MALAATGGRPVHMVIDLTNSSRYYDPAEFERAKVKYVKVRRCRLSL
jgi:mRNA-capping enzyme